MSLSKIKQDYEKGEGSFEFTEINGVKTKVYTKYLTGTLDADAETQIIHGVSDYNKILSINASVFNGSDKFYDKDILYNAVSALKFFLYHSSTKIIFAYVGSTFQGKIYRIALTYYK